MEPIAKIRLLENRLDIIISRGKDSQGVCRRIRRDIRNLKKKMA